MNSGNSFFGKTIALIGAILQLSPVLGFAGFLLGMQRTSQILESTPAGNGAPVQLLGILGNSLLLAFVGLGLGILGLVLLFVALLGCRYRAPWFFWFLIVYGLAFINLPLGSLLIRSGKVVSFDFPIIAIGIFLIVFCLLKKKEFSRAKSHELS